jgi:hypothetical protein
MAFSKLLKMTQNIYINWFIINSEDDMRRIFHVHDTAKTIRLTKDLVADGFNGDLQGYANSCALVLLKTNVTRDTAVKALEAIILDLDLRETLKQR